MYLYMFHGRRRLSERGLYFQFIALFMATNILYNLLWQLLGVGCINSTYSVLLLTFLAPTLGGNTYKLKTNHNGWNITASHVPF